MRKVLLLLIISSLGLIFFQNCSHEFQPLDENIYGSEYITQLRAVSDWEQRSDEKYLSSLISSSDIVFDSLNMDTFKENLFLDDSTFFIVIRNPLTRTFLNLTVDADQKTSLVIDNSNLVFSHEAPANNLTRISYTLPDQKSVLISGRVGKDPKNILLMVNGEYLNLPIETIGNPMAYNYLDTLIESSNTDRVIIFKRTLEPPEMNVFSRYLAKEYNLTTKTDPNTPDVFVWSNSTNSQFLQVKTILSQKCFSCHNSWISLSETDFTKASIYTKNKILVTPKSLEASPLWFYLSGSSDTNTAAPRSMPLNQTPLSASELQTVKDWIMTSTF